MAVLAGLLLFFQTAESYSNQGTWATVSLSKDEVTVGEPLMITITLYTSTWFTSAPQFGEIQVPGAIMVDFPQRTGSLRKKVGSRSYPAIEKKYLAYPMVAGENTFPPLRIVAETPPEGDYRGRRVVVRSPERVFTAVAPEGIEQGQQVITAYDLRLTEEWNGSLKDLKQGDVLERSIQIRASGAIAALIPPLEPGEGSFGSVYNGSPSLSNAQGQNSFTGTRIEHWTYLLEAEGEFSLPAISLKWYHPGSGNVRTASLPERSFSVAANPEMDFLLSMQDSLQALLAEEGKEEPGKTTFWGLAPWQAGILLVTGMAVLYLLVRLVIRIHKRIKIRKERSVNSEAIRFRQLEGISRQGDAATMMKALFRWYDSFRMGTYEASFRDFLGALGDVELTHLYAQLEKAISKGAAISPMEKKELITRLKQQRLRLLKEASSGPYSDELILNPR
jgi:hypothetical protein